MTFASGPLDRDGKPIDALGRRQLHRLNALTFGRAVPGFWDRFREVPERFYKVVSYHTAQVNCPCGAGVTAEIGALTRHDGCARLYLFTGKCLLVANSPTREGSVVKT